MYDLYGVFPHTGRGLSCQLSVFLSEGVCRVSPLHWLTAGVTDRPSGTGAFPLMADVEIWHSLNLAHVLTEWKHISVECARLYSSCGGTSGRSRVVFTLHPHTHELSVDYDLLCHLSSATDVHGFLYSDCEKLKKKRKENEDLKETWAYF